MSTRYRVTKLNDGDVLWVPFGPDGELQHDKAIRHHVEPQPPTQPITFRRAEVFPGHLSLAEIEGRTHREEP